MSIEFCPLCKSIMKEGLCTNRKCGNSKLEIDFNKFVNLLKKISPNRLKKINNSYLDGLDLFENSLTFNRILRPELKGIDSLKSLKPLIEAGIDINIKFTNCMVDENKEKNLDEINVIGMRYFDIRHARCIPAKIYKHYIDYYLITTMKLGEGRRQTAPNALVYGSNDLEKWHPAGLNSKTTELVDDFDKIEVLVNLVLTKMELWTLKIIDNNTGISINTFFSKDKAYELFKDREIKQGKKKRTALKHIVTDYEREKPRKVLVKEHLRGDMIFQWRGITFKLYPPTLDEKRIVENKDKEWNQ